jgi:hypothetical protein
VMDKEEREKVHAAIVTALTCSAGFEVTMFGDLLGVRPLEDGRFAVSEGYPDSGDGWSRSPRETIHNKADEAVEAFLNVRDRLKLGYDYERAPRGPAPYDPTFGDDKVCACGHAYYRHFDTYDNMSPVGCKYCHCTHWQPPGPT